MKVIIASTIEQEERIKELVGQLKEEIFPRFFEKEELQSMYNFGILQLTEYHFQRFDNLQDAFQVISSLQTIISILETDEPAELPVHYQEMFERNTLILQEFDIDFPFFLSHFTHKKTPASYLAFAIPANTYLI
ncbi:DUF5365 family protein [Bacillus badius]|uniref:YhcU family protein n=1 Tax=Bacillus badius TaxID=1455 RepID=A0ABR5AS22_BACBA|nr:DUF5365 family protein [Bacillus badius]KIL73003.1 hypothetical protein SD78_3191 [Bacillus badius]KIL77547.1 hypothetical protein SD77_1220 [Bacillus badius]MED4716820.1 DUF5365 family protein [Bacillus badius]